MTKICPDCDATVHTSLAATPAVGGEKLESLIRNANLLLQNAEGCAVNHYGLDFEHQGMPGWLADTRKQIEEAAISLRAQPASPLRGRDELRKLIAAINVDDDKHPEGNLQYVLIRGFSAMGWSQPTLASNEALDAIVALSAAAKE